MYLVTGESTYGEMIFTETARDWDGVKRAVKNAAMEDSITLDGIAVWQKVDTVISATVETKGLTPS